MLLHGVCLGGGGVWLYLGGCAMLFGGPMVLFGDLRGFTWNDMVLFRGAFVKILFRGVHGFIWGGAILVGGMCGFSSFFGLKTKIVPSAGLIRIFYFSLVLNILN